MLVRIKGDMSGTRNGARWPKRGETIDLPPTEAAELCATGIAEPVEESRIERAVAKRPEKRTARKS